jgi:hypothetical protein
MSEYKDQIKSFGSEGSTKALSDYWRWLTPREDKLVVKVFRYHLTGLSLIIILVLTIVVTAIFLMHVKTMTARSLLVLPYVLWLILASSLNWYAWIKN